MKRGIFSNKNESATSQSLQPIGNVRSSADWFNKVLSLFQESQNLSNNK